MAASEAEERGHKRRLSVKHTFSVRREITAFLVGPVCVHAKSLQSCPTLCDPVDSSPDLPDPRIEPMSLMSPALAGMIFTTSFTKGSYQKKGV